MTDAALGELRQKMRHALATRHVVRPPGQGLTMLDDHVAGHIGYSVEEQDVVFVVDGVALSLQDIGRLASGREGCQFSLRFADPSDELLE